HTLPPLHLLHLPFDDTATPDVSTLSLHDALPISRQPAHGPRQLQPGTWTCIRHAGKVSGSLKGVGRKHGVTGRRACLRCFLQERDRKSTRLNSSHVAISYAVFCLKKKINI